MHSTSGACLVRIGLVDLSASFFIHRQTYTGSAVLLASVQHAIKFTYLDIMPVFS